MRAIILAGGKGERMGDLTNDTPKPLLLWRGKPILEHQLDLLVGIEVGVVVKHRAWDFQPYKDRVILISQLATGMQTDLTALLSARNFLAGESSFLVLNADVLIPAEAMRRVKMQFPSIAVYGYSMPLGMVIDHKGNLNICDKPVFMVNAGVYHFTSQVWQETPYCNTVLQAFGRLEGIKTVPFVGWKHFTFLSDLQEG